MKNKIKYVALLLMVFSLTGCATTLKDKDNKPVTVDGKTLTENILCQPTNDAVINKYKENNIDITKLPSCNEFQITDGEYHGLWESLLVKPFAFFIILLIKIVKNAGIAVILVGILLRAVMIPISNKTAKQSENMKKAQPEINRIEKKYIDKTDQNSLMLKSQEIMMVYKKYNINPVSGCLFAFLQLPLFFVMLEAINRVPIVFEGNLFGLQLGMTPMEAFTNGNFWYLILIILMGVTTYYQFKMTNMNAGSEQASQMQFMMKFMVIMILFSSLYFPTALALYWIASSLFTLIQNFIVKGCDQGWKNMFSKEKKLKK